MKDENPLDLPNKIFSSSYFEVAQKLRFYFFPFSFTFLSFFNSLAHKFYVFTHKTHS